MREWIGIGTNAVLLLLGGALTMSSSTVAGTGSLANGGSVTLTTTTLGVPLDNQGTLVFQGTSSMSGALTTGAGTTLRVQGSNTVGTAALTVAAGFTNNGAVELTAVGGAQFASLNVTSGTLVNAPGRTISALAGSGGTRSLNAELNNQGQVSVAAALTINKASADHVNLGWIDVSGCDLAVTQSGTTPTLLEKTSPPLADRVRNHLELSGHRVIAPSLGRTQDDARSKSQSLRGLRSSGTTPGVSRVRTD